MNLLAFLAKDLGQGEPRIFDVEGYEHAVRLWTVVLEIAVLMAQFPSQADRAALLRVPHARPRLRQCRRPADVVRHPLRLGRRPPDLRHADRDHDRHQLRDVGRDGEGAWPLPRLQEEPRGHAARDAQPPPRRLRRALRLREGRDAAGPARPQGLPATRRWSSTPSAPGTAWSSTAPRTASATRRSRWWRRPAPSAW